MNRLERLEAQGARCGHIDGKRRVGVYVIGEECLQLEADYEPYAETKLTPSERIAWTQGYESGYRVGADGEDLDAEIVNAPLP